MCDGSVSITQAITIEDKYGIDIFNFSTETLGCLISDIAHLRTAMVEEQLDSLPPNPRCIDVEDFDDEDDWDNEWDDSDYEDVDDACFYQDDITCCCDDCSDCEHAEYSKETPNT